MRPARPIAPSRDRAGFSLIELLTVIAVIGILAALIFPAVSAARQSANRAKTKVQFNQWAGAIEGFRGEYGYYPAFHDSGLVNGGATTDLASEHLFHDVLAGRRRDGGALAAGAAALTQNRKRITFHAFSEADFTGATDPFPHLLRDAFGNLSIAVLVDRNLDGRIDASDYSTLPAVSLADGSTARPSSSGADADFPVSGLRMSVAFYCADPTASSENPRFILSWK